MRTRAFAILFLSFVLVGACEDKAVAWGPISHMTILDDMLRNSSLNSDVKKILEENLKYAKGGATGPDMYYFFGKRYMNVAHYCSPGDFARKMLEMAKKDGDPKKIAFAYGWMIHVASDPIGHAWVNSVAGGEYGDNPEINSAHSNIEWSIDKRNLMDHGQPSTDPESGMTYYKYDTDFDSPDIFNFRVSSDFFECRDNAPAADIAEITENTAQLAYNAFPNLISHKDENQYNTAEYRDAYQRSISEAIKALNSSGGTLENWDLDTGEAPTIVDENNNRIPNPNYGGYRKCREQGKLEDCGPVSRSSAGNDHSDDTVSVGDYDRATEAVSLDSLYRLAPKKGKKWVLWLKAAADANAEYNGLPPDASPELRQEKSDKILALVNMLNDPTNWREFSANNSQLFTETEETPDIAVLENGYFEEVTNLINRSHEPVRTVSIDFSPTIGESQPVFIIPSGGLYGMEKSEFLKASLDEYVKNGGTLIVFGQQHGYEFSVLPVPQEPDGTYRQVTGYGWSEDQSCRYASSSIDTWHQILSGLSKSTPTINVDGYFTDYPSNATVLLRRTANGQPDLLMYEYGQGRLIVTSMFSDYAFKQNQASPDEIALIRDIISWAKKPAELPEIKPGQSVSVSVLVTNDTANDVSSLKFLVYNPDRTTVLSEQSISASVPAGQSVSIPVTYTTTSSPALGIYHIDYALLDAQGNIIQPKAETDSGRFAVSNPAPNAYESSDFNFSIQSDAENYFAGSPITLTVNAWNNTDVDHIITLKYSLPSIGIQETVSLSVSGKSNTPYHIVIPEGKTLGVRLVWIFGYFYEESGRMVGSVFRKGMWIHSPSAEVTSQTDKTIYNKGERVTIDTSLKNNIPLSWQSNVKITVKDFKGTTVYEDSKTLTLPGSGTASISNSFLLTPTLPTGSYSVNVQVPLTSYSTGAWTRFEIPQSQISVSPNLPSVYKVGTNTIPFTITNTGKTNVNSGTLDLSLKAPDGEIVYSGNQPFSLLVGETKTLDVPISIPSLKLGFYVLTYSQMDETSTGKPANITIRNFLEITSLNFGKDSYRVKEIANLRVDLKNSGNFNLENISVNVSAPDVNYTDTQTISLGVNSGFTSMTFAIPIPETISPGLHNVDVAITSPGGDSVTKQGGFVVPQSSLAVEYQVASALTAGDTLSVVVENTGGVDTNYDSYVYLFDNMGFWMETNTGTGIIQAATQGTITYTLPDQLLGGGYTIRVEVIDKNTSRTTFKNILLSISGLYGDLIVRTDKDTYFSNEEITTLSTIVNQGKAMVNGNLHLEIACAEYVVAPELESFHIFTYTAQTYEWTESGILHFPNAYEQRELLLPFSPDQWGNGYLRIGHDHAQSAYLDYLILRDSDGNLYPPYFVGAPEQTDITSEAQGVDGIAAWVTGQMFYAFWENLPSGVSYTLVMVAKEGCGIAWETDTTINQGTGITRDLNTSAGIIGQTGKYYLRGMLINALGQIIGASDYSLYIIDGDTVLLFNPDKRIYKPGETVTITGSVENRAPVTAENLILTLTSSQGGQSPQMLLAETINLLSGGNYPFTIITTAGGEEGVVNLVGTVKQNDQTLITISDQYEVANPLVSSYVGMPATVGNEPFTIEVEIYNDGKVDATVQFGVESSGFVDSQTITIPAFGMKLLQYSQEISKDVTYTFTFAGDHEETISKPVTYGLGASIQLGAGSSELGVFPEGSVAIPFRITGTGQLAEPLAISFTLSPGDLTQTKTYYLQPGSNTTDTLYFNLTEGDYQISATSQKPDVSTQANLSVRKENQVQMGISLGAQTDGLVPVNINLTNGGFNEINGNVRLDVTTEAGQVVWSGEQALSQFFPQNSQLLALNINPSAIDPGNYNVQVTLLSNSNQPISTQSLAFGVEGPNFQITQLPPYQTFSSGQEATFTFAVKNIGNQEGSFDLRFNAYDLIDSTRREWLKPKEEKTVTFGFMLPEDLEEKDYFATYEINARSSKVTGVSGGQIKYHLAGISLNVNASLDKPCYAEGETAHLTINIQSPNSNPQNLFARMNYAGYEPEQTFTLDGTQILIFDIPLPKITGEKLFYGIYHEGGRSIHLNSVYIHKIGDVITIATGKQVYNPGEVVSVSVFGNASGDMTLSGPGGHSETFAFTGSVTKTLNLPSSITAGTYFINVQLTTLSSELISEVYPFDVAGIQVKVLECNNDKGKYASSDNIATSFTISSNTAMPAILKGWIVDPTGQYASVGEQNITLSSSESSLITYNSPLTTSVSGIHRLVYGIYGPEDLLLCSGSEAFDVGDAVLLGISTDKVDYPQGNESVVVKAGLYGSVTASLEFYLDGQSAGSQSVSLNGLSTLDSILPSVTPGPHTLKVVLTAGGLTSTKETIFTYGSGLPDLTFRLSWDQVIGQSSLNVSITAVNQGKSPSGATTLHLYDGEISGGRLLFTFDIPTLSEGQSQTFTFELSLLGRVGVNTLSGVVDPTNNVYEFNESNNRDQITFTVPEVTLSTTLEKDAYFPGEVVPLTSLITNLSKDPLAGLVLSTDVKDQAEVQVFTTTQNIPPIEGMTTASLLTSWSTDTQLPEGIYTIRQSIVGKEIYAQRNLTFIPGKDFTITTDAAIKKIEVGEAVEYHLQLTPLKAFKGEIHLSSSGYPENSTAYFTPNPVTITDGQTQSILTVIPPDQAGAGSYSMKVNATGGGISHDFDLSLNLTDFEMILVPTSQTLPQIDKANYTITLNPLNGFDHGVTLEVNDIPPGMRASLGTKEVLLPQSLTLSIETSKWLLPGEYRIPIVARARTVTHALMAMLNVQRNPLNIPGIVTVPGLLNKPIIHTFNLSGGLLSEFQVVDGGLGVDIAAGDADGDGVDEVIAATGWKLMKPGRLGVFRRDGTQVAFMETEQGYVSDLTVAAGDFDGDWVEEVVLGFYKSPLSDPLHGGGGVKIYKVMENRFIDTGFLLQPYQSEGYFGPPSLTVSDVDGDGVPELITAPGPDPRAPAKIKVYKIDTSTGVGQWRLESQPMDFIVPFNVNGFGAHVAAGDLDGDGRAEIMVGAGPDPRKKAEVVIVYHEDGEYEFRRFTAYEGLLFGVNIAAADVDGDGISEILTGPGPDPRAKSKVRIFRRDGTLIKEFQAYPDNIRLGVKVSTGRIGE